MSTKNDQQRMYKDLAKYFPIITPPEDYLEECEYFAQVIKNTSPIESKTLLDLGCGGGNDDFALKKHFKITAVDVSPEMLKIAKKLNPEVKYLKGDMRFVRLKEKFDAVTIFDSINYMVTKDDLRAVFSTAYEHLKPGGVLVTIAEETPDRFVQNKTKCSVQNKDNIEVSFIENYFDPDIKDTTYEATFVFLIREKGKLRVETDFHLCGIFPLETWFDLLQETGFTINKLDFNVSEPEARTYPLLVCVKPTEK
ncbi:MAG: class I SAM-dependent methyltransferase [Candidatus Margulisbacteria bacterium]|nr:class I SAM-dependent methyltransferase [Candidatus Margulisiibacteriota bacterium]